MNDVLIISTVRNRCADARGVPRAERQSRTMNFLSERATLVELQVGNGELPLVEEIAQLQEKLRHLYRINPELRTLDDIERELGGRDIETKQEKQRNEEQGKKEQEEAVHDAARKQELVSMRYAQFAETLRHVAELQAMQFPDIPSTVVEQLNVASLASKETQMVEMARHFHALVVKTLVALKQVETMIAAESRFWSQFQKKLDKTSAQLGAIERSRDARHKY
ncbi:hypothetical protein EJF18_40014 [Clavispora lusitaniae]|uniref:Uncharacterized protein n=1 Tax=Clavispora lusitaniae TaxID=36911 RepID=A0ACD0WKC1_CLALS|nr:hypothetical protein EJF14_40014 [Clavispora lusitaniae]QFZ33656.1 hypothetical protein EJF16_40014 [Clavispora lusitaniae]QFZ39327.1 hypothetical protein EJF15_40014 [Clavispora lusitaniae]QFZ45009.1 hypothetical protein EJF18_40014 [Clavispora lusitaniae]QFZ50686.1 hypothetical protein EJF17_40014 [Clavispora lusitaniae]